MESVAPPRLRYQLVLGKWPVEDIKPISSELVAYRVALTTPSGNFASFVVPFKPDLKPGDLLTIYTELERDVESSN